ncbi:MAG: hypothetical protein IT160_11725 [Bryobacterales bacterium]|nr:hypothetical protein [Bryobacterales bacterium]
MVRFAALILLAGVCLAAPTSSRARRRPPAAKPAPAPAAQFPIEKIRVLGNRNYSAAQIIQVSGLRVGEAGSQKQLETLCEQARNRLLATGFFERAGAGYQPSDSGKGYLATLEVTEMAQVFPYRFENLPMPADQIRAALSSFDPLFSPRIPASQPVLDRYAAELQRLIAPKEKVTGRLTLDTNGGYVIVFRPNTPLPVIAEIHFPGASAVPEGRLRAAVAAAAVGTPYTEAHLRQLLELNARPVYEAEGYLRVKFGGIRTGQAKDVSGLIVSVQVDEGSRYQLHSVSVEGPVERPGDLVRIGKFKLDDVANFDRIEEGRKRIEQAVKGGGYFQAKTAMRRDMDDKRHFVSVTIAITPGPLYTFGKLNIEGLDLNAEAEMRKLWGLKPGKPFNANYPGYFLSRVREDGYFDNLGRTSSRTKVDEAGHIVDVTLVFRGVQSETPGILRQQHQLGQVEPKP